MVETRRVMYGILRNSLPLDTNLNKSHYILTRLHFNSYFQLRIPYRREWRIVLVREEDTTSIYNDGSKIDSSVGALIYFEALDIPLSFHRINSASIFQTELIDIRRAVVFY